MYLNQSKKTRRLPYRSWPAPRVAGQHQSWPPGNVPTRWSEAQRPFQATQDPLRAPAVAPVGCQWGFPQVSINRGALKYAEVIHLNGIFPKKKKNIPI